LNALAGYLNTSTVRDDYQNGVAVEDLLLGQRQGKRLVLRRD
jgi:hypothetical protein